MNIWLIFLVYIQYAHGLIYYYTQANTRYCFYHELHKETILVGKYKLEIYDESSKSYRIPHDRTKIGVVIDVEEVFNSRNRIVHQRGMATGQFTFNALESGSYKICLTPKSFLELGWFGNGGHEYSSTLIKDLKFRVARVGVEFVKSDAKLLDSRRSTEMTTMREDISRLLGKLSVIRREQKLIREKEAGFRDLSEQTCETVIQGMMIQLSGLFIILLYQLYSYLKSFYSSKQKLE